MVCKVYAIRLNKHAFSTVKNDRKYYREDAVFVKGRTAFTAAVGCTRIKTVSTIGQAYDNCSYVRGETEKQGRTFIIATHIMTRSQAINTTILTITKRNSNSLIRKVQFPFSKAHHLIYLVCSIYRCLYFSLPLLKRTNVEWLIEFTKSKCHSL